MDETSPPSFQTFGGMLSHPAAFPFFRAFNDCFTSVMVTCRVRMSSSGPSVRTEPLIKLVYSGQDHSGSIIDQFSLGSSSPTKRSCAVINLLHIPLLCCYLCFLCNFINSPPLSASLHLMILFAVHVCCSHPLLSGLCSL